MSPGDGDLVRKSVAGDHAAFGELVARYRDMVCGLAYHHLGSFDDVQDAAQEAFVRAWVRLRQLSDPDRFAPWLRRIATNVCLDLLRRRHGQTASLEAISEDAPALAGGHDPERLAVRLVVRQALSRLPEETRLAVTLFYIDGYSQEEVGRFLEVPVNTVRSRLQRAKRQMREEMVAMTKEHLEEQKPGKELEERVLKRISAADVWPLGPEEQRQHLGQSFLIIDGELAELRLMSAVAPGANETWLTTIEAERSLGATGKPVCLYRSVGNRSRYFLFGEARIHPDGPVFADQVMETHLEARAAAQQPVDVGPWEPAEVSSAALWALPPEERDRYLSSLPGNIVILLDGGVARARLFGGGPGDSTASAGREVTMRNVGTGRLYVYLQEWPGSRYYIFGEAEVTPPGIRVKDTTIVLEARVESR